MTKLTITSILCMAVLTISLAPVTTHAEKPHGSGVQGQFVISPTVSLSGIISGGTPTQGRARVLTSKGRFVTSFASALDGTFQLALKPGDYLLVPDPLSNPYVQPVQTPVHV